MVKEHSITIDRDDDESRAEAGKGIYKELADGKNIAIFPEGGRTLFSVIMEKKVLLQPFLDGIFRIAYRKNIPIQPLVFDWPVIWRGKGDRRFGIRPTTVDACFLQLVYPAEFNCFESFRDFCWNLMNDKLSSSKRIKNFLAA